MTIADRAGLIERIKEIRSRVSSSEAPSPSAPGERPEQIQSLEARVLHLEHMLEGLQDSVHRESERQSRLIAQLRSQVSPGALAPALAEDARTRGV